MASEKKLVKPKSGLRAVPINEGLSSPITLPDPIWTTDESSQTCSSCDKKFNFMNRRHHCRRCGKCFCDSCCGQKDFLPRMCFVDPVRQCNECIVTSKKENEFFDKHLKKLLNGAQFEIESTVFMDQSTYGNKHIYVCKLSSLHREVVFDCVNNNVETHDAFELMEVESLQVLTSGDETPGGSTVAGLSVKYRDSEGVHQTCKLLIADGNSQNRKQALGWIAALRMAMIMVFEKRKGDGA